MGSGEIPKSQPDYLDDRLWRIVQDTVPEGDRHLVLHDIEEYVADTRANIVRAMIRERVQNGEDPLDIIEEYGGPDDGPIELEGLIGPNWELHLAPDPKISILEKEEQKSN